MNHFLDIRSHALTLESGCGIYRTHCHCMIKIPTISCAATTVSLIATKARMDFTAAMTMAGARKAILALIENYTKIVLDLDDVTLKGVRKRTV